MDPHKPPKLLDRLRETLRRRHYSIHTEDARACRFLAVGDTTSRLNSNGDRPFRNSLNKFPRLI